MATTRDVEVVTGAIRQVMNSMGYGFALSVVGEPKLKEMAQYAIEKLDDDRVERKKAK